MNKLEIRLRALEGGRDPRTCLECEMGRLNRFVRHPSTWGHPSTLGACAHWPKPLHQHLAELITTEVLHAK